MAYMTLGVALIFGLPGCGGGGGDGDSGGAVCTTLKIAGGEQCSTPPRAIALVATDIGYCTGTFITHRHVLTAAHCFRSSRDDVIVAARGFSSPASSVAIHPQYDGSVESPFDVAVVTADSNADVVPVPLLLSSSVASGDRVVTYGYGVDQSGNDILTRVQNGGLPLKATSLDIIGADPGTIASISDGSGDTCQGDSGGALLETGRNGTSGIVGLVRAGPPGCEVDSGLASENTNVQTSSINEFILARAPGVGVN